MISWNINEVKSILEKYYYELVWHIEEEVEVVLTPQPNGPVGTKKMNWQNRK